MAKRLLLWLSFIVISGCLGVLIWIFLSTPRHQEVAPAPPKVASPEASAETSGPVSTTTAATPPKAPGAELEKARAMVLGAAARAAAEGFHIREDYWGGTYVQPFEKTIVHKLFKGNEYWFWMASDRAHEPISIHVYDPDGRLAEVESWQHAPIAAARITPTKSGNYFVMVQVSPPSKARPDLESHWVVIYAFR